MILAAGLGRRLQPLTDTVPKPLIEVKGKSLLVYQIERLKSAGFKELVINVHHLGNKIIKEIGSGEKWGVSIAYSREDELLETGGGIVKALSLLGEEPFLVVSGDLYTEFDYQSLPKSLSALAHIVLTKPMASKPQGDFALLEGQVLNEGPAMLNFAGIGIYHPELFKGYQPEAFPLGPILRTAIANKKVTGQLFEGVWHNVGTPLELETLNSE